MGNREVRQENTSLHLYLAFARTKDGEKPQCIRTIDKGNGNELAFLEAKLKILGGTWRIHKTVNSRDVNKAMKWLLHDLIEHPEHGAYIDSQWRTALLQKECNVDKKFMLDVDTDNTPEVCWIRTVINESGGEILEMHKSPKGWHFITKPFDTREVLKIPTVTLLRDGYYFCKIVNGD